MGVTVIDLDIKNLPLEDFMRAMGYEPVDRNANLLTYEFAGIRQKAISLWIPA